MIVMALDPAIVTGKIVLCDRGTIGRLLKCIYVRDAGGAGCILANVDGGDTDLVDDAHVLPAIHVDAADGNALKTWLASGSDHRGTIEVTPPPVAESSAGRDPPSWRAAAVRRTRTPWSTRVRAAHRTQWEPRST